MRKRAKNPVVNVDNSQKPKSTKSKKHNSPNIDEQFVPGRPLILDLLNLASLFVLRIETNKQAREKIVSSATYGLQYPQILISKIAEHPLIITRNKGVILALMILSYIASGANNKTTNWARDLLKKMGLPAFIPKRKNVTTSQMLFHWQKEPEELLELIDEYKQDILEWPKKCELIREQPHGRRSLPLKLWKPRGGDIVFKCCIENAYTMKTGKVLKEKEINSFNPREDITVVSLRFISILFNVPYEHLKKQYYMINRNNKPTLPDKYSKDVYVSSFEFSGNPAKGKVLQALISKWGDVFAIREIIEE